MAADMASSRRDEPQKTPRRGRPIEDACRSLCENQSFQAPEVAYIANGQSIVIYLWRYVSADFFQRDSRFAGEQHFVSISHSSGEVHSNEFLSQ